MPKGGLLHAHLDATVNVEVLMRLVSQYRVYYVSVEERLAEDNLFSTLPLFDIFHEGMECKSSSLTDQAYTLGSWIPYHEARQNFGLGGPQRFDDWVKAGMTINPQEAYVTYNSSIKASFGVAFSRLRMTNSLSAPQIWKKFSSVFRVSRVTLIKDPSLST
jgi:adenosine deaminase CECR1